MDLHRWGQFDSIAGLILITVTHALTAYLRLHLDLKFLSREPNDGFFIKLTHPNLHSIQSIQAEAKPYQPSNRVFSPGHCEDRSMLRSSLSVIIWFSLEDVFFIRFCRFLTGEPAGVGYAIGLHATGVCLPLSTPPSISGWFWLGCSDSSSLFGSLIS